MAYTRWNESGHYIFGGADYVDFDGVIVPDDEVDVFIFKLFDEGGSNDDFWSRYNHGKRVIDNFQKGIYIQKLWQHAPDELESHSIAIANLADQIWREHYTPIIGMAQVDYMLEKFQSAEQIYTDIKKNGYIYFTAKDMKQDRLVGYCAVVPQDGCVLLSKLYVQYDFRGKGISRSFLDEILGLCKYEYGYDKIRLSVNKHNDTAIKVYKKMGFETIDSVKVDIGGGFYMDDYVMELILFEA